MANKAQAAQAVETSATDSSLSLLTHLFTPSVTSDHVPTLLTILVFVWTRSEGDFPLGPISLAG